MSADRPWARITGGLMLTVRLTPKGGKDAIDGFASLADGQSVLKARVRSPPTEGEANEALCRLIAKNLSIPPSNVKIFAGATSRIKRLRIVGQDAVLIAALEKLCTTE
jgi:uncharacterized protein (TIGR00251 family)